MVTECPRHGPGFLPSQETAKQRQDGYYVARCTHIGDRAVVQVNDYDDRYMIVDYVQFRGAGELVVEPYSTREPGLAETIWNELLDRLRADDPPVDYYVSLRTGAC